MRAILLIAANLFAFATLAQEVLVTDDGPARIDVIGRAPDGWPQRIAQRPFVGDPKRAMPNALPAVGRVLKGPGPASLWKVTRDWDWNLETEFSAWIRAEVDAQFFVRLGLATDCADVAYALRWIFARAHGLPMSSRLASGDWLTQDSVRGQWQKLPADEDWRKDKRFFAALNYLLDYTYTHTLISDAYPVAIRPDTIMEGGFHLFLHGSSGHTRPITRVARAGETGIPVMIMASTVPRAVRPLMSDGFWDADAPTRSEGGFLRFRWPDRGGRGLVAAEDMPNHSLEQYAPDFASPGEPFFLAVFRRIQPGFDLMQTALKLVSGTQDLARLRVQIVTDGYAHCAVHDCSPGTAAYDDWSTFSRDARLAEQVMLIYRLASVLSMGGTESAELYGKLNEPFLLLDGNEYSLRQLEWSWRFDMRSSDPRDPPEERWGVAPAAVSGLLARRLTALWDEREAKIKTGSDCPAALCTPGSKEWESRSVRALDRALIRLLSARQSYCDYHSSASCQALRTSLQTPYPVEGRNWSLEQALTNLVFINSDPRHSAQVRRFGFFPAQDAILASMFSAFESSDDLLIARQGVLLAWSLKSATPQPLDPPAGAHWAEADLLNNRLWFRQGLELGFTGADGIAAARRLTLAFSPTRFFASSSGALVLSSNDHWALVRADQNEPVLALPETRGRLIPLDKDHFLVLDEKNAAGILSVNAPTPHLQPISIAPDHLILTGPPVGKTAHGWIWSDGSNRLLLLRRRDGALRELVTGATFFAAEADGGRMVYTDLATGAVHLSDIDEEGRSVSDEVLDQAQISYHSEPFVRFRRAGANWSLFAQAGSFVTIQANADEDAVAGARGDLVIALTKTDQFIVRRQGENKPLLTSSARVFFPPNTPAGWVSVCDQIDAEDFHSYYTGCRVVDVNHPGRFSIASSTSAWTFSRSGDSGLKKGAVLAVGENSI